LVHRVEVTGESMKKTVEQVVSKKAGLTAVRGLGTSLYIDTADSETAKKLQKHLLKEGVLVKLNEGRGTALKPSLLLEQKHVDIFAGALSRF
jgi:acetylornithine/succinyldiaminopimelate/putrescine aminotransferase